MKSITNRILPAVFIFFVASCESDEISQKPVNLTGNLISSSDCKSLKSANGTYDISDSLSCIDYSFDSKTNHLTIQHINAGFNCCPGNLSCDARLKNDSIIIQEFESAYLCSCECLYDLEIAINGVDPGTYQIKFIEPYIGDNAEINFELDLSNTIEGSYCVTRKHYPWGVIR